MALESRNRGVQEAVDRSGCVRLNPVVKGADGGTAGGTEWRANPHPKPAYDRDRITEFALPNGSEPVGINAAAAYENPPGWGRRVWFTERGTGKVGAISEAGILSEFAVPAGPGLEGMGTGPDGRYWFATGPSHSLGAIEQSGSNALTEYPLPEGDVTDVSSFGSPGSAWYAESTGSIGTVTVAGSVKTVFSNPSVAPTNLSPMGGEKAMWYTNTACLVSANPCSIGFVKESGEGEQFLTGSGVPGGIAFWTGTPAEPYFTMSEGLNSWIMRCKGSWSGICKETIKYPLPLGSKPGAIVRVWAEGDRWTGKYAYWFTEEGTDRVGRLGPEGSITEFQLPLGSLPTDIGIDEEGNAWVTLRGTDRLAKIAL